MGDRVRLAITLGGTALFGVVMLIAMLALEHRCERGHVLPLGKTVVYVCDERRE